ncbi:hypothetical protein FRC04_000290 [Tulasnella sp. 424]|nr:hypothetical protein FRC04_000290 [Tulasnella sp. 424]KAG8982152.1 hypothetical protein FRC05_000294 [Tulasnella sp. 425]
MLGSTLLSAATALFFLPAVFSAPIASAPSVSVSDVSTTISTTKSNAIQRMTTVFVEKQSEVQTYYDTIMAVDASTIDMAFASNVCGHLSDMLRETINGVQAASTVAEDSVAVKVNVATLIEAIVGILSCVFGILYHILEILKDDVVPLVQGVLVVVFALLKVVVTVVGDVVLPLVAQVVVTVVGLVPLIKNIVDCDVNGILTIVAYLGIKL